MQITILPGVGTNQAVAEVEDGESPVKIISPRQLSVGEQGLLLWRLYRDISGHRFQLDHFKHLAYIAPLWCLASGLAAYLRFAHLWSMDPVFLVSYGWTTVWLVCDGIWLALQVLTKIPLWLRDRKVFASLKEQWEPEVVIDSDLKALKPCGKEHDWVRQMANAPDWAIGYKYRHLYARLLKRYPPRLMDFAPVGIWRYLRLMILGVPVRRPWLAWPIKK